MDNELMDNELLARSLREIDALIRERSELVRQNDELIQKLQALERRLQQMVEWNTEAKWE